MLHVIDFFRDVVVLERASWLLSNTGLNSEKLVEVKIHTLGVCPHDLMERFSLRNVFR